MSPIEDSLLIITKCLIVKKKKMERVTGSRSIRHSLLYCNIVFGYKKKCMFFCKVAFDFQKVIWKKIVRKKMILSCLVVIEKF